MPRRRFTAKEISLLDQIHADPRNDSLRLAYADWLAQRNDPFGAFIRITMRRRELEDRDATGQQSTDSKEAEAAWNEQLDKDRRRFVRPLPDVLTFRHEYDGSGFPIVHLFATLPKMDQAWKEGSPRHCIIIHLDAEQIDELPAILDHAVMTRIHEIAVYNRFDGDYTRSRYERLSKAIAHYRYLGRLYTVTFPRTARENADAIRSILGPLADLQF